VVSINKTILVQSDKLLAEVLKKYSIKDAEHAAAYQVLVAAYKHLEKQKWVAEIVATILGTDLDELGRLGGFAHPEHIPQKGKVPNLPGWNYFFHGMGCCLTHIDGVEIDVDFPEGRYDVIDPYFFANYLSSLSEPSVLEAKLVAHNSLKNVWMGELPKLKELELIKGDHAFSLTEKGLSVAQEKAPLWEKLEDLKNPFAKAHVALLLGDSLLARDFLIEEKGSNAYIEIDSLASKYQSTRFDKLMLSLDGKSDGQKKDILKSAASIDEASAIKVIEHILGRTKFDTSTFLALELIDQIGTEKYLQDLERLIDRTWRGKLPQPGIRVTAVGLLMTLYNPETLPKKLKKKLIKALSNRLDRMGDKAAQFLYLLDKAAGLKLFKKNLDSGVPYVKDVTAATLATINNSESIAILENNRSVRATTMLAIVNGIGDRKIRTYTFEEIEAANMESWLRSIYEESKKEYLPLMHKWER